MPADHVIERAPVGELLRREAGEPRPKALDLFCCAGGASMGLHRAGFDVTGVDIKPQPRYPFRFIQADALHPPVDLSAFDFIWASPPCQHASWAAARWKGERDYPALIEPTRAMLAASGVPYVIENVVGAAVRPDLVLTGEMFGLRVIKRRHFELGGWWCMQPERPFAGRIGFGPEDFVTTAGHGGDGPGSFRAWSEAIGIDWMTMQEMAEAIPPDYAEFIGRAALRHLGREPRHDRRKNFLDRTQSGRAGRGCHPDPRLDARMSKSRFHDAQQNGAGAWELPQRRTTRK